MFRLVFAILLAAASLLVPGASRASVDADPLRTATALRLGGHPDQAREILAFLLARDPGNLHALFELGVTEASLGNCPKASEIFDALRDRVTTPSLLEASEAAMRDLCLAPSGWSSSVSIKFHAGSNINGGATERDILIGGLPYRLSDEDMAQSGFGLTAVLDAEYRHGLGVGTWIVPSISLSATDATGTSIDGHAATLGLDYRRQGASPALSFGPRLSRRTDSEGVEASSIGLRIDYRHALGAQTMLSLTGKLERENNRDAGLDATRSFGSASWMRVDPGTGRRVLLGAFIEHSDTRDILQDVTSVGIQGRVSGELGSRLTYEIGGSLTRNEGALRHPLFGARRQDTVFSGSVAFGLRDLSGDWGIPQIGLEYTRSVSTFATQDYDRTSLIFGISRAF